MALGRLDIVNTVSKAGGVGALLQIADHPSGKTYLPSYDGNGNIAALLNADTGDLAAAYEYSAFGEPLRAQCFDPTMADNPFRFSTKFMDSETGLVYYGHRYYTPREGRFINRDPIEESGGLNLYGFCGNDGVNRWDLLGLEWVSVVDEDKLEEYDSRRMSLPFLPMKWIWVEDDPPVMLDSFVVSAQGNNDPEYSVWLAQKEQEELRSGTDGNSYDDSGPGGITLGGGSGGTAGTVTLASSGAPLNLSSLSLASAADSTGQTSVNASKPNGDAPTEAAPNSAGTTSSTTGTKGVRLDLTAAFGIGATMTFGVVKDTHGDWDVQFTFAKTTALPGASATIGYTHTTANSVKDLTGWGAAVGVSGGDVVGGEANFVFSSTYKGGDYGIGVSTPGASPQVMVGYTWSLVDVAKGVWNDINNWVQPQPAEPIGVGP